MSQNPVEPNGPANIVSFIEGARANGYKGLDTAAGIEALLAKLENEAWNTIHYMHYLENPKNVRWGTFANVQNRGRNK